MSDVEFQKQDGIATITLNRPRYKNAFTLEMLDTWAELLEVSSKAADVRVVVVTGAGGNFCSGVDLDTFQRSASPPLEQRNMLTHRVHQVARAMEAIDKPVLAAVSGVAVGAGMDMSLMCDMRFAGTSARFSEGYIKIGLIPGDGGCWLLPRIVGRSTALRLLWSGDVVAAEEAKQLGIVDEVFEDHRLQSEVLAFAQRIASQPPIAIQMIKRAVRLGASQNLAASLDLVSAYMAVVTSTVDFEEAFSAFRAGRTPTFVAR